MVTMPRTVAMANGDALRVARENKGLSQRALAASSGVAPATVFKIENGKAKNPHPGTLRKLADALGIETSELIARG